MNLFAVYFQRSDKSEHRLPSNVAGDFYTTGTKNQRGEWEGDCLWCGMPEEEAPMLFSPLTDKNLNTYLIRQPMSHHELDCAIKATRVCCVGAVRYGGRDKAILEQIDKQDADYRVNIFGSVVRNRNFWWKLW